jgi:tRNA-uridine 2-sulfurtransferase
MVRMKAVALISGGLDSVLAAKVVMGQGFEVIGLYFTSAFCKSYGNEHETHAARVSKAIGIDLRVVDMGQDYIDLVRNPVHGYGKNVNPCIDCKIYMLKNAKAVMQEVNAPFVVTGEVLGQRPMSQRRDTFHVIERDSDMRGMILRPLSATLLPPTKAGKTSRHKRTVENSATPACRAVRHPRLLYACRGMPAHGQKFFR